jgi:starch-binding outer membrane protein, SusD/RagB family
MKTTYIKILSLLLGIVLFGACENDLIVEQQGSTSVENFYKTDNDALEAVSAVYLQWRTVFFNDFIIKNMLSDEVYAAGGSRGDNSAAEQINEYKFSAANTMISGYFSGLYTMVYRANLVINKFQPESDVKKRVIAEAKVARAWSYFNLVTFWGNVPLVTKELAPSEYQQPNADKATIWALIESDLKEAIESGALPEKSATTDKTPGARLSKQAAQAFLGKAQLFQGKYSDAAATLKLVINSKKYELIAKFEDVLRATQDFGAENIFETNSPNDADNAWNQGTAMSLYTMSGWRGDKMNLFGVYMGLHDISAAGWGFFNPTKKIYDAFVAMEGASGFRLNSTLRTYPQVMTIGAPMSPVTINAGTSLYGHEGYFNWKHRLPNSEAITNSFGYAFFTNYRLMRYSEVLLMASEACLQSGDNTGALDYINQVRTRAKLTSLTSMTLTDVKKEKQLELYLEGTRYQDLVRWGDAATVLAEQGKQVPVFSGLNGDGSFNVSYPYTNSSFGFKTGKNELLPYPEHEMNVNQNIKQNTGW